MKQYATSRFQRLSNNPRRFITTVCLLLSLSINPWNEARATDDELLSSIASLADVIARIRVISENCQVGIDPMLEGRIFDALGVLPNLDLSKVASLVVHKYQNEADASGTKCDPGAVDHLASLKSIYRMSVADLRKVVASVSDQ